MSFEQPKRYPDDYHWGAHPCIACRGSHWSPYETWCRAERMRLFPANFGRWTENEHAKRGSALTWEQQQTIWHHRDTWEAMFDGELTEAQARTLLANSEPLPPAQVLGGMIRALARGFRPTGHSRTPEPRPGRWDKPDVTADQEAFLMGLVRPVETPDMNEEEAA